MATRMQQRRGTAAQWTSANPILNAGEMGWESDTNKFKIGDGTNHWADLDYFADINSTVNPAFGTSIVFEGATADSYETTLQVTDPTADRTITFPDATGTVALTSDIAELSQDAIDAALTAGTGITKTYNDAANTLTLAVDTTVIATKAELAEVAQDSINDALVAGTGITKSYNDGANTLTLSVDTTAIQARVADVSDTEIGYLNGVTSGIQTQLDAKAPTANASFTGTFSAPTGTITSTMIADGTIVDGDISASAAIDKTKISGTAITAADTGTVTSTMIADGTIVDGDINASAAIAQSKIANLTTDLAAKLALAGGTMTGAIAMGTNKITGLGSPTADADAATKAYVDAATAGLNVHASVQAATTANVTLASALENGDTLDGVTLATGNRVLVKNQTDKTENGVYVVKASGAPDRATDYDSTPEVDAGDFIFVEAGTVNGKTGWVQTNVITTVGSDNIEFTQFSGAGTYLAGTGLTLTGNTFSANIGTDIQAYNSTLAAVAGGTYTGDDSITTLGTITTGTWNGTTIAVANGGTGITSFGTGIATFLGTPSSANLASAITDETGSGALVFANTPTLTTPDIGAATGTSLTTTGGGVLARAASTQDGVEIRGRSGGTGNWEVILTPTTLTSDQTLTLPNETGTLLTSAQFTAKGTLLVGTGSGTYAVQTVGTNGQVLTANSALADGVEWTTPAGGAAFSEMMLIGA